MKGRVTVKAFTLILAVIFCCRSEGYSTTADSSKTVGFEFRGAYGFIIRHHLDMGNYTNRHFSTYEFNVHQEVSGNKPWHTWYKMPTFGLSYWYSDLGKTKILGDVHAVYFWGRVPVRKRNLSSLNIRFGAGLGYFNKTFDRYTNYKNLAIGSHFNANLQLQIEYRVNIYNNISLAATAGLTHFSNGTMKTPNYGINIPQTGLVLSWSKSNYSAATEYQPEPFHRYYEFNLAVANGFKEILPVLGRKYLVFAASADWLYQNTPRGSIGAGLDIFWDGSEREILDRTKHITTTDAGLLKPGIKAIKGWNLGNLRLQLELGVYLWEKETSDGSVYDKIVMQYSLSDRFYVSLFLKTHYARADFIGWGIGMRLKNEK